MKILNIFHFLFPIICTWPSSVNLRKGSWSVSAFKVSNRLPCKHRDVSIRICLPAFSKDHSILRSKVLTSVIYFIPQTDRNDIKLFFELYEFHFEIYSNFLTINWNKKERKKFLNAIYINTFEVIKL